MALWIVWLIIAAVLLLIELLTGFVATLCMGVGCLAGVLVALAGFGIEAQLGGVAVGIVLSFIFLAPLVNRMRRRQSRNSEAYNSNMDALIGREARVHTAIPGNMANGRVIIDGDNWQARSKDGEPVAKDTLVRVTGYDSIVLIVKPV